MVFIVGMILYVLGLVLLFSFDVVWILVVFVIVSGLSEGIMLVNWGVIGDYFGRNYYVMLCGIINLSYSWALLLVLFAVGWWFD